jgi:rhodanese-related sulfurtransferase
MVVEAAAVVAAGALLGLAANAVSPRGLELARDYFPRGTAEEGKSTPARAVGGSSAWPMPVLTNAHGLQLVSREQAAGLFRDVRYEQGKVVFVDARGDWLYRAGHIPGAYQLDPYQSQKYLPLVLPVCQAAERVLVYCTGTNCEDSETAAILLQRAGIPNEKMYVFKGGYTEWTANSLPLATGEGRGAPEKGPAR